MRLQTDDGGALALQHGGMTRIALILVAVVVVFAALSNTVGDGNLFGGIAFFVWALALLALIGLGVRSLAARGRG